MLYHVCPFSLSLLYLSVVFLSGVFPVYVSAYSGLVAVLVAVVVFDEDLQRRFYVFLRIVISLLSIASILFFLRLRRRSLSLLAWLHFTRIRELNGIDRTYEVYEKYDKLDILIISLMSPNANYEMDINDIAYSIYFIYAYLPTQRLGFVTGVRQGRRNDVQRVDDVLASENLPSSLGRRCLER